MLSSLGRAESDYPSGIIWGKGSEENWNAENFERRIVNLRLKKNSKGKTLYRGSKYLLDIYVMAFDLGGKLYGRCIGEKNSKEMA